ncbi:MAG: phosphatase PAP2 family protein [Streptosporangiaceae bacterium]|nr:phosphatase PAP2 family protein [Streptosporangiaceae bacterium]
MPHFMLSWQDAAAIGVCLALAGLMLRPMRVAAPLVEAAVLFGLYALWQFAGSFAVMSSAGGPARGRWIWHVERLLHLPSETAVQHVFLPSPALIQTLNLYYDVLHFPVLISCLIWVYWRHRPDYPRIRTVLVLFTAASLLVQLIPVAPPRLLLQTGMVDTAFHYGQSVYTFDNGALEADQYSAMPSVHVGWAIVVAIAVISVSRSRWRWLAVLYPAMTTLAVVVTANHFWLDGIVAGFLVVLAVLADLAWRRRLRPAISALAGGNRPCNHDQHGNDGRESRDRIGTGAATRRDRAA